ncbi:unnamed protein product [Linum tenue]|uniref:Uncharacterized protein n=1 Tax=Linum tenue TaxID=586396 RepID=A0AAV0QKM8_9ROSI|nr:unnamed protein product [Linum tenue]
MDSRLRAFSSPELVNAAAVAINQNPPSTISQPQQPSQDYSLEGIAANVKLLLKVIRDHNEASAREFDDRKTQRVAGMITILDDIKARLERSQSNSKKRVAQLRRCNTDLRPNRGGGGAAGTAEKKAPETAAMTDDKEKLKKQLSSCKAARKSLEMLCSSLGKEKEIMVSQLARRVSELSEMEELVNLLKAQNETLTSKLQASGGLTGECQAGNNDSSNAVLLDRNEQLSDQLLKSLDSYRALKRKYKGAKEECSALRAAVEEETAAGLARIRRLKQKLDNREDEPVDIEGEIRALEKMFVQFKVKILKEEEKRGQHGSKPAPSSSSSHHHGRP